MSLLSQRGGGYAYGHRRCERSGRHASKNCLGFCLFHALFLGLLSFEELAVSEQAHILFYSLGHADNLQLGTAAGTCVIHAVLSSTISYVVLKAAERFSMAPTEQYFSSDKRMASSIAAGSISIPVTTW